MKSLAVKYRPATFEEVLGQTSTITILKKQLEKKAYTNCYLFAGPSGEGKTTTARLFASSINGKPNSYIEIDAASNSSVDSVRSIIASAYERSIDSEYKIYIIDEAHAISSAGWQAFLKCIEEPPKYTIFMFCTTNPEKIPDTIKNRVMRFNLSRISTDLIRERLELICKKEGYTNYFESCDYIAKLADGGCRDAIAMLEKCAGYDIDLSIDNVLKCLGNLSYKKMFELTNAIIDGNEPLVIQIVEDFYNEGNDLKLFIDKYLDFVLDLNKYSLLKSMNCVKIPSSLENDMKYATGIENAPNYFGKLVNSVLNIKIQIKYDNNARTTVEALLLSAARGL